MVTERKIWWVSVRGDCVAVQAGDRNRAADLVRTAGFGDPGTVISPPPGLEKSLDVRLVEPTCQGDQQALDF